MVIHATGRVCSVILDYFLLHLPDAFQGSIYCTCKVSRKLV